VLHPLGEPPHGLRVVGGVHQGLGEQRQRTDRGLQLVAHVGDEVAADLRHPVRFGHVVHLDSHVARGTERDDLDPDPQRLQTSATRQLELDVARFASPAGAARQHPQRAVRDPAVADDADAPGSGIGEHHLVGEVQHHQCRAQRLDAAAAQIEVEGDRRRDLGPAHRPFSPAGTPDGDREDRAEHPDGQPEGHTDSQRQRSIHVQMVSTCQRDICHRVGTYPERPSGVHPPYAPDLPVAAG
jgi:hypothetical protein